MKHLLPFALLGSSLVLASCAARDASVTDRLSNPLFAERYAEEMVYVLTEREIQNDPLLEDAEKVQLLVQTRQEWVQHAQRAREQQREGMSGHMFEMGEYAAGEVLLLDDSLFFASNFETLPGPDLRVYLSTVMDPRDVPFPDASSIDLGQLPTPYGAQRMGVPDLSDPLAYRTVVLWEATLGRLYGFAQLTP